MKDLGFRCDMADERQIREMAERTVESFGRLDAAYTNAGIQSPLSTFVIGQSLAVDGGYTII